MCNLVECRSGNEYAERPLFIYWQDERLEIDKILGSWRTPEGKWFRVSILSGLVFELFYDEVENAWDIMHR